MSPPINLKIEKGRAPQSDVSTHMASPITSTYQLQRSHPADPVPIGNSQQLYSSSQSIAGPVNGQVTIDAGPTSRGRRPSRQNSSSQSGRSPSARSRSTHKTPTRPDDPVGISKERAVFNFGTHPPHQNQHRHGRQSQSVTNVSYRGDRSDHERPFSHRNNLDYRHQTPMPQGFAITQDVYRTLGREFLASAAEGSGRRRPNSYSERSASSKDLEKKRKWIEDNTLKSAIDPGKKQEGIQDNTSKPAIGSGKKRKRIQDNTQNPAIPPVLRISNEWQGVSMPWSTAHARLADENDLDFARRHLEIELRACRKFLTPCTFENHARKDLIAKIERFMQDLYPEIRIRVESFGSWATDMHLPNSDMDLVANSEGYEETGASMLKPMAKDRARAVVRKIANALRHAPDVARQQTVAPIPQAKVPIIKFKEMDTGFLVDLCFENTSGVDATDICKEWATREPGLPFLVRLVKLFLCMRNMNNVAYGGVGGFSLTCMAFIFLLRRSQRKRRHRQKTDLGQTVLGFFEFWGSEFKPSATAVDMTTETLQPVHVFSYFREYGQGRLMIVHPQDPANNITGGSRRSSEILMAFKQAAELLKKRLDEFALPNSRFDSVMGVLFNGNYESLLLQRQVCRDRYGPGAQKSQVCTSA